MNAHLLIIQQTFFIKTLAIEPADKEKCQEKVKVIIHYIQVDINLGSYFLSFCLFYYKYLQLTNFNLVGTQIRHSDFTV
jgi:hypothetical protein